MVKLNSGGGSKAIKLKIKTSAPPTPATETAPSLPAQALPPQPPRQKRPYNRKPKGANGETLTAKNTKKRAANEDISPAAKRLSEPGRKFSLKLNTQATNQDELALNTPSTAAATPGGTLKLKVGPQRKESMGRVFLKAKKKPPPRPVGVGYDSEASDAEIDPAIEQQFILRMEPGEDADYLRTAIAEKRIGIPKAEGGADVSFRFLDRDLRRAMVTVRGHRYAAALVDLPCIVEGMKSWDKRGWWKVADICQMLLVLGRVADETAAKEFVLPREVDKHTWAYAHGLTPPMHWVRKRRFRKRVSYRTIEHVEEEVEKLLKDDEAAMKGGGSVKYEVLDRNAAEPEEEDEYEEDAEGYVESTENTYGQQDAPAEEEADELDAALMAAFENGDDEDETALPPADAAANLGAVLSVETPSSANQASTPAEGDFSAAPTPAAAAEEHESASSDEDEDDDVSDEDGPDTIDEDLVAQQAELNRNREELADLERAVEKQRSLSLLRPTSC
ncbi:hypothetical protein H2203_000241 [Taxawa tesnikishii (nom. ined.)]|nr:hypothetical protein H2203_000241 [Dothideales sp. JES 119]